MHLMFYCLFVLFCCYRTVNKVVLFTFTSFTFITACFFCVLLILQKYMIMMMMFNAAHSNSESEYDFLALSLLEIVMSTFYLTLIWLALQRIQWYPISMSRYYCVEDVDFAFQPSVGGPAASTVMLTAGSVLLSVWAWRRPSSVRERIKGRRSCTVSSPSLGPTRHDRVNDIDRQQWTRRGTDWFNHSLRSPASTATVAAAAAALVSRVLFNYWTLNYFFSIA